MHRTCSPSFHSRFTRLSRPTQFAIGLLLATLPATAQSQLWIAQFGTNVSDEARGAAEDGSGGVYVFGSTDGSFGGPNAGATDSWLARYDSAGNQLWVRQLGTMFNDFAQAAAPDGAGGVYVCGDTEGSLGGPNAGSFDPWLARYDGAGNQVWILQLGTNVGDFVKAAATDGLGGVYVSGSTSGNLGGPSAGGSDAWLAHYDSAGIQSWIRQIGTSSLEGANAATSDGSGGVYVGGSSAGQLGGSSAGGSDAWLARYDSAGMQSWIRQLGTSSFDGANSLAPDGSGGVHVLGQTEGSLAAPNFGLSDAWLARFDGSGSQTWIQQLGTSSEDWGLAAAPDGMGGVYVSGGTKGSLGAFHAGNYDAWLAHYTSTGNQIWIHQIGSILYDYSAAAAPDGVGGVYFSGYTNGFLGGAGAGGEDAWLARYAGTCGPAVAYCIPMVSSSGCTPAMTSVGTPSLGNPAGFGVGAGNLEVGQNGLLFFGMNGSNNVPFLGGTLCVKAPLNRLSIANTGGVGPCAGSISYTLADMLAHPSGGALGIVGTVVHAQVWSRDPPAVSSVNGTALGDWYPAPSTSNALLLDQSLTFWPTAILPSTTRIRTMTPR